VTYTSTSRPEALLSSRLPGGSSIIAPRDGLPERRDLSDTHLIPTENAKLAVELDAEWHSSEDARRYRRGWKAWMLAPTLDIYRALMEGQTVPVGKLDPEWVTRFGTR